MARGYPVHLVHEGRCKATSTPRALLLAGRTANQTGTKRVPMVTTYNAYHPKNTPVGKILSRNYIILTNDDSTRVIFSQPPLKAYRRAKNLRDLLVHSDFPRDQPAQQPGTFPCKRTICRTCPHINQSTSIPPPGGQIKITGHFTCTSENVIYCISCRKCPRAVYIGETGRRLADRFREHRLDVLHKKNDLPVAQHFNSPGHPLQDVRVAVVKSGLAKKDVRQRGDETNLQIPNTRFSRNKSRFLISIKSPDIHARAFFRTRKQFQNGPRMQITVSLFCLAALTP